MMPASSSHGVFVKDVAHDGPLASLAAPACRAAAATSAALTSHGPGSSGGTDSSDSAQPDAGSAGWLAAAVWPAPPPAPRSCTSSSCATQSPPCIQCQRFEPVGVSVQLQYAEHACASGSNLLRSSHRP